MRSTLLWILLFSTLYVGIATARGLMDKPSFRTRELQQEDDYVGGGINLDYDYTGIGAEYEYTEQEEAAADPDYEDYEPPEDDNVDEPPPREDTARIADAPTDSEPTEKMPEQVFEEERDDTKEQEVDESYQSDPVSILIPPTGSAEPNDNAKAPTPSSSNKKPPPPPLKAQAPGPSSSSSSFDDEAEGTSTAQVAIYAGVAVGVIALLALITWCFCRHRSQQQGYGGYDVEAQGPGKPSQFQAAPQKPVDYPPHKPQLQAPFRPQQGVTWHVAFKRPGNKFSKISDFTTYYMKEGDTDFQQTDIDTWVGHYIGSFRWHSCLMYNDQPVSQSSIKDVGHAKGFVMWDQQEVIWVVHSFPNWPNPDGVAPGVIPLIQQEQCVYGQHIVMVRMQLGPNVVESIVQQIAEMDAHVYYKTLDIEERWNQYEVNRSCGKIYQEMRQPKMIPLRSKGDIMHIAKRGACEIDIYHECIAKLPELGGEQNWFVMCWNRSSLQANHQRGHYIQTELITDVEELIFPDGGSVRTGSEHSKWAIIHPRHGKHLVFIGDLNRETSQFKRGGGGFVIANPYLWRAMAKLCQEPQVLASHEQ